MLLSSISTNPLDFLAEGSQFEVIDDAGHFMHVEQPEIVNRLILDFLAN
jgi:pimeloyl-ACP methyl ester carboxylesterase